MVKLSIFVLRWLIQGQFTNSNLTAVIYCFAISLLFRFEEFQTVQGNAMNIVADVVHLCDSADVVDHVSCGLYQLAGYVFRGLPSDWKVQQDVEAFLKTISFKHKGISLNPHEWPLSHDGPLIFEHLKGSLEVVESSDDGHMMVISKRNIARRAAFFNFAEQEHNFARLIHLMAGNYNGTFDHSTIQLGPAVQVDTTSMSAYLSSIYHTDFQVQMYSNASVMAFNIT
jgi:hypothetical protein